MSLKSHLGEGKQSPIGRFLYENFSQTDTITKEINKQLRSGDTIKPGFQAVPYTTLGTAIDYRIRYSFAITPSERLVAWEGAWRLAIRPFEGAEDIPIPEDERSELWDFISNHAGMAFFDQRYVGAQGPYSWKLPKSFFHDLDVTLAAIKPSGR